MNHRIDTTHKKPAGKGSKHVSINPNDIKESKTTTTTKAGDHHHPHQHQNKDQHQHHHLLMEDESAHTFAPASQSGHTTANYRSGKDGRGASSPVMITDALGDVRANYHIEPKELGHGHYGVVRKCMHRESGDWYAIKSIRKSKVSKIEVLKREIEILKEVKHPHIIELFEVYEDERYLHLITELCTGGELFDRIIAKTQSTEGHFSEHDAAVLVRAILDAIRYCHDEKGIVHRDLKPENFLFLNDADDAPIKIIDFGLSRHDDADLGIMQTKVGSKLCHVRVRRKGKKRENMVGQQQNDTMCGLTLISVAFFFLSFVSCLVVVRENSSILCGTRSFTTRVYE
jgi:Protein kinase domain